jgi:hypothetical protein
MTNEQVFQAATKVYSLYGAFFKAVAQEVGLDIALALHTQAHKEQGTVSGKILQEKMGQEQVDIQKLGSVLRESNLSIGIDSELAQSGASSALFRNARCPMYDGYRLGGVDNQTAEALCQKGATAKLGTMLKCLDPNIKYRLKHYRKQPDEVCEEEIFLT